MARKKRWEEKPIVAGYGEVKLLSWRYFFDFVHQTMLDYHTYIWRGHRNDNWLLEPTLDRLVKKAKVPKTKRHKFRNDHLEQFKYATRGRRGANPPLLKDENDWWALGQHYGLATPLLDWTASPFVAAYFAFIGNESPQTRYRAVYALHKPSIEKYVEDKARDIERNNKKEKKLLDESKKQVNVLRKAFLDLPVKREVKFIRPFSDENQRLVNQGGLFTRSPDDIDLTAWVQESFQDEKSGYYLMKILIPNNDRESCLKGLNRMNINHLTLFPDLYGATTFCNLYGEIKQY